MLERFKYTNSFGETLDFGKNCLFVNENDLRDFAWEITSKNNKISSFRKGIVSKTVPIILKCDTEYEGIKLRNRLFEVFEKDVLAMQYGKVQIGDYYLRCYITGSKKTEYLIHKSYMVVSLTVQTDLPEWIKETTISHDMADATSSPYLDFSYDYPHDYKSVVKKGSIINPNFVASNFIMTIHGAAYNPTLRIGGHIYSVNVQVEPGEYLTIDSSAKTIILTKANNEKVNCFNNRNKDSYIFEKIPPNTSEITTLQPVNFTITLLEERSEPKWI